MQRKNAALVLLLMAGSFGVGYWHNQPRHASAAAPRPGILFYRCPMHPNAHFADPGTAPCCGMRLEPVYADAAPAQASAASIEISPERQQLIGVRTGAVRRARGTQKLRVLGRVEPDEARVYHLTAKVDGWVREIFPDSTGTLVRKGQPLVSVYSRDLQTAQQAYIFALKALDRFQKGDEPDALDRLHLAVSDARVNLEGEGMSADQIELLDRTRTLLPAVKLVAPGDGIIVARSVYAGQRFDRGVEFYRIVDLSHVWILADVFEPDARFVTPGAVAQASVPKLHGAGFTARVSQAQPQFDATSRTLKLRLEADNPRLTLKPDMYVDLAWTVPLPPGTVVPADAVLDSGLKKTVFVERDPGRFEPREVETGWREGEQVEILRGLQPGERIVVSGTFLLDSESRMKTVAHR